MAVGPVNRWLMTLPTESASFGHSSLMVGVASV
jgi:hypothetical protein